MYIVDMFSAKINERESSLCLIFTLSSECAIIMAKLLDGYYRGLNSFYEIVKVCPNVVNAGKSGKENHRWCVVE